MTPRHRFEVGWEDETMFQRTGFEEGEWGKGREEEEKMREENQLAVGVMQTLNEGTGSTEPKGQKGGGDREEERATARTEMPDGLPCGR